MHASRVVIAEILRPRGNQGEVLARSQTDVPGRLESLKAAHAQFADGSDIPVAITTAWVHRGDWILKFAGVDSIAAAEQFRGADLWIPAEERATLADGEFYRSDLIGFRVIDRATNTEVGAVTGWQEYGGPPAMEISANGRELLIPFVPEWCEVDLVARIIRVHPPQGLLEL